MSSPFQFLHAFQLEDKDKFFGREQETDELYRMSYKTSLLLLYGLSGTGKTSLIQCGLANRFDGPDWLPVFVRRQNNILDSLRASLKIVFPTEEPIPEALPEVVKYLYRYYLRPVYLIFDQFEELFILGSWEERKAFIPVLQSLVHVGAPCRIILSMREEYIGQLYEFEKDIPTLFDFRLRLEPMTNAKVQEVIRESFHRFNIELESPSEDRLQQMIDNLSAGKSGIQLPYLQVYLDLLYREDFKRAYKREREGDELPKLIFTKQEIHDFGAIDKVLEKFLRQQEQAIFEQLQAKHADVAPQIVRQVLDVFATEEGTKRPVHFQRQNGRIQLALPPPVEDNIANISSDVLTDCIEALERSKLLRFSENLIELAHDSLADLIDKQRSDEQKQLNEIKRRLRNNFIESKQTKEFLSRRQLNAYEEYLPHLALDEELETFIEESRRSIEDKERAESERQKHELRRTRQFLIVVSIVAMVAVGLFLWALQLQQKAVQANNRLVFQIIENYQSASKALRSEGKYSDAIAPLRIARAMAKDRAKQKQLDGIMDTLQQIAVYVETADSLSTDSLSETGEEVRLPEALQLYSLANELSTSELLNAKINQIKNRINTAFDISKERGLNLLPAGCKYALPSLQKAARLRPDDVEVQAALRKCQ